MSQTPQLTRPPLATPGIKFYYGPDTYYGEEVSVLEMDGQFDKLEELIYVESHLSNTGGESRPLRWDLAAGCPRSRLPHGAMLAMSHLHGAMQPPQIGAACQGATAAC
jgi:hypothetical protein